MSAELVVAREQVQEVAAPAPQMTLMKVTAVMGAILPVQAEADPVALDPVVPIVHRRTKNLDHQEDLLGLVLEEVLLGEHRSELVEATVEWEEAPWVVPQVLVWVLEELAVLEVLAEVLDCLLAALEAPMMTIRAEALVPRG